MVNLRESATECLHGIINKGTVMAVGGRERRGEGRGGERRRVGVKKKGGVSIKGPRSDLRGEDFPQ